MGWIKSKKEAIDEFVWANYKKDRTKDTFELVNYTHGHRIQKVGIYPAGWGDILIKVKFKKYSYWFKNRFKKILKSNERPEHWNEIISEFEKIDQNVLDYIIEKNVPIQLLAEHVVKNRKGGCVI